MISVLNLIFHIMLNGELLDFIVSHSWSFPITFRWCRISHSLGLRQELWWKLLRALTSLDHTSSWSLITIFTWSRRLNLTSLCYKSSLSSAECTNSRAPRSMFLVDNLFDAVFHPTLICSRTWVLNFLIFQSLESLGGASESRSFSTLESLGFLVGNGWTFWEVHSRANMACSSCLLHRFKTFHGWTEELLADWSIFRLKCCSLCIVQIVTRTRSYTFTLMRCVQIVIVL